MPRVKFTGVKSDNTTHTFEVSGGCLACIGRSPGTMVSLRERFAGSDPALLSFVDCNNMDVTDPDILRPLWSMGGLMRSCLSTPETICEKRNALFNIRDFSYNEVMFAMFHLRTLCNDHAGYIGWIRDGMRMSAEAFIKESMEAGLTWKESYVLSLIPEINKQTGRLQYTHHGRGDASCFSFGMPCERLADWLNGRIHMDSLDFDTDRMARKLEKGEQYTQNIEYMLYQSTEKPSVLQALRACVSEALEPASTGERVTDLFGKTSGNGPKYVERVRDEQWGRDMSSVLKNFFGEELCN